MTLSAAAITSLIGTILAKADTGTAIGLWIGAILVLAFGAFIIIMVIRGMMSAADPDITVSNSETGQSRQVGRSGLVVFLILGVIVLIGGIGILVGAIKAVS